MPEGEAPKFKPEVKIAPAISPRDLLVSQEKEMWREALNSKEGVAGLKAWRDLDKISPNVKRLRRLFDRLSAYEGIVKSQPEMAGSLAEELKKSETIFGRRTDELAALFLAKKLGQSAPTVRPEVKKIFESLSKAVSTEGEVNAADLLASARVSFGDKQKWFEAQVLSAVKFLEKRDLAEARKKAETPPPPEVMEQKEQSPADNIPPPENNTLAPSMEEMAKAKEGEPGAFFTIAPFYGGYYREGHFARWNSGQLRWDRGDRQWQEAPPAAIEEKSRRVVSGVARGGEITPLPMPYGFAPDIDSLKLLSAGGVKILKEEGGGWAVKTKGGGLVGFSLEMGRGGVSSERPPAEKLEMSTGQLSPETEKFLAEVKRAGGAVLEQARKIKAYTRRILKYSNDSAMNNVYRGGAPSGYFQRIEKNKKADCDVANTFFVALLSRLEIPARLVAGHYVKSKNQSGAAVISSGTGHAWAEVYDGLAWQRLDATPPGDPNMDEEETDEKPDEETGEGDFGEQEAKELSDEELAKMISEAEKALKEKGQTPQEKKELTFAEAAGCSPEEAKRILGQIETARGLRDRQGRLIKNRLLGEFQKIIQENLVERLRYKAPVRMSSGENLVEPVEAFLDLKSGEADPTGFAKHEKKIKYEQAYGGFDVIFVTDKSGSMSETDPSSGLPKWAEQQKFVFLLMDALHGASQEFKRQKIKLISPLDVRAGLVSFNAGGAKVELPLGTAWGPKEQHQVWKSLQSNVGGGTPDHLGLGVAQSMIADDAAKLARDPKNKNRLRLVLVSADGGSDNAGATLAAKEGLKAGGAIVKAAGIGAGAKAVEAAYYPDGKNLADFNATPDWAAEQVIAEAKRLYPKKVKK